MANLQNISVIASRDEIKQAFEIWNKQATEGGWPNDFNADASADHFIETVKKLQEAQK